MAGYGINSRSQVNNPVYISRNSYYNPLGTSVVGAAAAQDLFFYRRVIENPRSTDNKNKTVHIDAALEGSVNLAGTAWDWSVGYNHSSVSGTTASSGNINLVNLAKALGPSYLGADGVVRCGTSATNTIAGCVPFDILGGPNAATPEALEYINHRGGGSDGSTVNSATADISGTVLNLPAGGLGFAAGLEHREVRGYDKPDSLEQLALTTN
ncbi:MAG TPA: TonB-dependent receptor, partial [Massilia sp.]|nr:TonB-dependent receptor [Massilia sp.]